jgi:hypothetical protein
VKLRQAKSRRNSQHAGKKIRAISPLRCDVLDILGYKDRRSRGIRQGMRGAGDEDRGGR